MDTIMEINTLIQKRHSPRAFTSEIISDDTLETMFEGARWAASSMNEQPWQYLYAKRGTASFNKMLTTLLPGNQVWAKHASHLIMSLAKKQMDRNGNANRHAMHDVGAANAHLLLQAAELNVYGRMMGGFDYHKAFKAFEIDEHKWDIPCFIAVGYKGNAEQLDEKYRTLETAPRSRKKIHEFIIELN